MLHISRPARFSLPEKPLQLYQKPNGKVMRKFITTVLTGFGLLTGILSMAQNVAINEDGSQPNANAILDVKSQTKGVLLPRMTTVQRNLLPNVQGMLVFDTEMNRFFFNTGTGWSEFSTGGGSGFWSANGTHIFNNNPGHVGIGTSNPSYIFTVHHPGYGIVHADGNHVFSTLLGGTTGGIQLGSVTDHNFSIFTNNRTPANVTFGTNWITDFKGTKPRLRLMDGTITSGSLQANANNLEINARTTTGQFTNPGHILLQTSTSGTTRLGNVGIGSLNPWSAKLEVQGGLDYGNTEHAVRLKGNNVFLDFADNAGVNYGFFRNRNNNTTGGFDVGLEIGVTPPLSGAPDRSITFSTYYGPRMVIKGNGNVGIGTVNPAQKLSVNGTVQAKEVVVETGWADYVFDDTYKLLSLEEVEAFISRNRHLPNIPPAHEVEREGMRVGDMQRRMMEKIEELTLYIIDLKKQIENLKKTN